MRCVWTARWSLVKSIFLINRYVFPLHLFFAVYGSFPIITRRLYLRLTKSEGWSGQALFTHVVG